MSRTLLSVLWRLSGSDDVKPALLLQYRGACMHKYGKFGQNALIGASG